MKNNYYSLVLLAVIAMIYQDKVSAIGTGNLMINSEVIYTQDSAENNHDEITHVIPDLFLLEKEAVNQQQIQAKDQAAQTAKQVNFVKEGMSQEETISTKVTPRLFKEQSQTLIQANDTLEPGAFDRELSKRIVMIIGSLLIVLIGILLGNKFARYKHKSEEEFN